jgi:hypothetical protein
MCMCVCLFVCMGISEGVKCAGGVSGKVGRKGQASQTLNPEP